MLVYGKNYGWVYYFGNLWVSDEFFDRIFWVIFDRVFLFLFNFSYCYYWENIFLGYVVKRVF